MKYTEQTSENIFRYTKRTFAYIFVKFGACRLQLINFTLSTNASFGKITKS